ncbi:MAG: hypothetical protein QOF83_1911 [Solirubrobacteraceae bacterium]|jgi:uncharacterized protein YbcI|nr:hypothetical protein [Solirubrobacteraceae bacterium]
MTNTSPGLIGGELNAAITRAVVRIHSQYVGRGPTKAQTFYRGPVVVTVMENALTKAERSLVNDGELEIVLRMRQKFQRTMRADLVSEIERLTGRKVVAFMSDNHVEPDLAAELFVLDGHLAGEVDHHLPGGVDALTDVGQLGAQAAA